MPCERENSVLSFRRENRSVLYRILSVPVSLIAILAVYAFQIPNPMMLLIIPVVFFTYLEGYVSGGLSGLTAVVYSACFFIALTEDDAAKACDHNYGGYCYRGSGRTAEGCG